MTLQTPITDARTLLQTDINGLSDTDAISLATEALLSIVQELILGGINAAKVTEAYMNATTDIGIYNWPDGSATIWTSTAGGTPPELWLLKTININYIDTNQWNYVEPQIIDTGNLPEGESYQSLRYNQPNSVPLIENRGSQFEIFPAPSTTLRKDNLTKFFYILYFATPTVYATTGDTVSYPINLNSRVLSARMAWIQAMRGDEDSQNRAKSYEQLYLTEFGNLKNIIRKGSQKSIIATGIPNTGYEY